MIEIEIRKFLKSGEHALGLVDFDPKGGYEIFLRNLCQYLDEEFLDWYQGITEGIGHITYQGYTLEVYWTDFPFCFSFDCRDKAMAEELQTKLQEYCVQP